MRPGHQCTQDHPGAKAEQFPAWQDSSVRQKSAISAFGHIAENDSLAGDYERIKSGQSVCILHEYTPQYNEDVKLLCRGRIFGDL